MSDTSTSSDASNTGAASTGTSTSTQQGGAAADTADSTDWKAAAEQALADASKAQADAEKWQALSRKHENRAKDNADAASKAKTVEEQLSELRKTMADRDVVDLQRNGRLAIAQAKTRLAEAGLSRDDMSGVFDLIDPTSLLVDGEPDDKAIDKLAKSLTKAAGRTTPDRDQGQGRGSGGPVDMNTLIRRAAGVPI